MLISPAQQGATHALAYTGSVTPSGVEQGKVRADIPPVEEAVKNAGGQNKLFFRNREDLAQSAAASNAAGQEDSEAQSASGESGTEAAQDKPASNSSVQQLSPEDLALVEQLRVRDREVRVHEAAHASVGGRYAGNASFEYTRGPDGRNYATGGEVSISVSPVSGDPQATIEKARVVRAAALAPAEPSVQDRRVAAEASQLEVSARADLQSLQAEEAAREKEARAEEREKAKQEQAVEEAAPEEDQPETPQVTMAVETTSASTSSESSDSADKEENSTASSDEKPRPNARQELEKILLGSTGLLQQANQQGFVNPLNPYGESGFLDVIV